MPEPKEDKVTTIGGGLRTSGLLKLGGVCRSLLKKGLFVLQCALTPPPHLKDASPSQQLFTNSDFQTTLTTFTGLHLAHTFILQSAWSTLHVSLRKASLRIHMSSTDRSLIPTRIPCPASIYTVHRKRSSNGRCILGCLH